jgi:hypothetical protein
MNGTVVSDVEAFARAARDFCAWANGPGVHGKPAAEAAARHVSALVAAACAMGWKEAEPADFLKPVNGTESIEATALRLPVRYYAEIFNNLVIPAEDSVVGDLVDDLGDIYSDVSPGLDLFDSGRIKEAENHWRFWFAHHWGEHATSALRALWSYLAGREGSDVAEVPPNNSLERTRDR